MGIIESFASGWVSARQRHQSNVHTPEDRPRNEPSSSALEESNRLLAEMTSIAGALAKQITEMEFVLKLPGVKNLLLTRYHTDKHPKANAAELEALTETVKKINAAYEGMGRKT